MLNHITIMGRLTRDPELRRTQSGKAVTTITVAVDRDYQPQGGEKQTDFIDVVAWEQRAEFISKYFAKGRMIIVEGALESRKWQDKNGNNRVSWEIRSTNVYFGDSKKDGDGGGQAQNGYGGGGYPQGYNQQPPTQQSPYSGGNGYTPAATTGGFQYIEEDGELPF